MNQKSNIHSVIIGLLVVGLLLSGGGIYVLSVQLRDVSKSVNNIEQGKDATSSGKVSIPATTTSSTDVAYVSCRHEYVGRSTNWGDAKLLCSDVDGNEKVILSSIGTKFNVDMSDGVWSVYESRFVSQGQVVYIRFRSEADVSQYGLSYYNLRTEKTGEIFDSVGIGRNEYIPETSAHFSPDGKFLVVASGRQVEDPNYYIDLQTIYVFDLRSASLLTKISAEANKTFLTETDCFRIIGDINVSFTDNRMTYRVYDKPIRTTEDPNGLCIYNPTGGISRDYSLPR